MGSWIELITAALAVFRKLSEFHFLPLPMWDDKLQVSSYLKQLFADCEDASDALALIIVVLVKRTQDRQLLKSPADVECDYDTICELVVQMQEVGALDNTLDSRATASKVQAVLHAVNALTAEDLEE